MSQPTKIISRMKITNERLQSISRYWFEVLAEQDMRPSDPLWIDTAYALEELLWRRSEEECARKVARR